MTSEELELAFRNAVESVNDHDDAFPADVLLKLYAYYKRATNDPSSSKSTNPLISAFKTNALFQTQGLSQEDAKRLYIATANHYFLYRR